MPNCIVLGSRGAVSYPKIPGGVALTTLAPGLSHCVSFALLTMQGWPTTRFGVCSWL